MLVAMNTFLDVEEIAQAAMDRTGLDDFGPGEWRDALDRLLDAAHSQAQLNSAGYAILRMQTLERLANRLRIQDWIKSHPDVHEIEVSAPIILATLPRTGQTAAGWILDRDPENRSLLRWFAKRPVPPPRPEHMDSDLRIEQEREEVNAMPQAILDMHLSDAQEPDECHWLISNDMKAPHEIYSMRVPDYYRWVRDHADMGAAYRYYALQLRMLQSTMPQRRWVLKNSPHLLYLHELNEVVPDAIYVQFHRDPLKVLASNCKLALILRRMRSDCVDAREVGASMLELLGDYADRLMQFRARNVSRPWIDIRFSDFVNDPLGAVSTLYTGAGLVLDEDARRSMVLWIADHPRDDIKRARPADLTAYGIDRDEATERFSSYMDRYGVDSDGI
jgi:hypothetical protein